MEKIRKDVNYVVSGLPRSGTSMMMQILKAGGMPIATDKFRKPDESNPKGYLEIESIIDRLKENNQLIFDFRGKVVKIISLGLKYLPPGDYIIIYMDRDIDEVLDSMEKMAGVKDEERELTRLSFEKLNLILKESIREREDCQVCNVNYNEILENPAPPLNKVFGFLDLPLDLDRMMNSVDSRLYRQRNK